MNEIVKKQESKTRKQLQHELAEMRQALEQAQAKIAEMEREELVSVEGELGESPVALKMPTDDPDRLLREIDELKRVNQKLREEKDGLVKQLKAADEKISKELEAVQRLTRENERLTLNVRDLEKNVAKLKDKLTAEKTPDEHVAGDARHPTSTFIIHFNSPQPGLYHGRIEHVLSKKQKRFAGLDRDAIVEFMSKYLPQADEQNEDLMLETGEMAGKFAQDYKPSSNEVGAVVAVASGIPKLSALQTIQQGVVAHAHKILERDQPFRTDLDLDLSDMAMQSNASLALKASIWAKRLGAGKREIVGEAAQAIGGAERLTISVACKPLLAGTYCLEAIISFSSLEGKSLPCAGFSESGFFQVC